MTAFDLDAALAEAREGETPFVFTFDGETYELPASPPIEFAFQLQTEPLEAMRNLLGDEAWARILESPGRFDTKAYRLVLDAYRVHYRADAGESDASDLS